MALSWNEIKSRALNFSKEWADETSENAEAKTFWDEFFQIFGLSRRRVASFEYRVTKENRSGGFIDLLWKGQLLVEHKSAGKNLDMAYQQAIDYFPGLKDYELPKYICVCNFQQFRLKDLDENVEYEFELKDIVNNVQHFGFIAGYKKKTYKDQDPANIEAAYLMGKLHDELESSGYKGHELEVYLVRILFLLFAEDTSIFEKDLFRYFIENKTKEDGSDLGTELAQLFQVLNRPKEKRSKLLDEDLNAFPYVNGGLFEENLPIASFNTKMRETILECSALDWAKISPAIFGSLFQSVKNPEERRNLGAHYTSEKNILKLIKPLFLDDLYKEFKKVKGNKHQLRQFHKKLSTLKFLDPACGCGNFLVITYRELRILELKILKELHEEGQLVTRIDDIVWLNIDQFYGIEIDEWPARISEVAMWLIDHQMNMMLSEEFGQYFVRLPLEKTANIVNGNALRIDWDSLIEEKAINLSADITNIRQVNEPMEHYQTVNVFSKKVNIINGNKQITDIPYQSTGKFDYIIGNPPFVGKQFQDDGQKQDMDLIFKGIKGAGVLDYVTAWYVKAAQLIQNTKTKVAFVSSNSISQGEQVGILWNLLFKFYNIKIHFAHRTFKWNNEAKDNANVLVVIIGFANFNVENKLLYHYEKIIGEPQVINTKNINPYLMEGDDIILLSRRKPLCNVPKIIFGSMPNDGGHLILDEKEKNAIINDDKSIRKYIRRFMGGEELLNNKKRYCLWLDNVDIETIRKNKSLINRIEKVAEHRRDSKRPNTRKLASIPMLFGEIRQPKDDYIIIPLNTSSARYYLPIAINSNKIIASNLVSIIPKVDMYIFGVLSSLMHSSWMRYVCGRLGNGYRYSNTLVYNNFPWSPDPKEKNVKKVKEKAQLVLETRRKYPHSSLADLYDPLTMPADLLKAHKQLDKAVDLCYRSQPFSNESSRLEFLFDLYKKYTDGMFVEETKKKRK